MYAASANPDMGAPGDTVPSPLPAPGLTAVPPLNPIAPTPDCPALTKNRIAMTMPASGSAARSAHSRVRAEAMMDAVTLAPTT